MQKRHLHGFLLILVCLGCGPARMTEENSYLVKNKEFVKRHAVAFSLNTQSDTLNLAFATLTVGLADRINLPVPPSRGGVEDASLLARAAWLTTRTPPSLLASGGPSYLSFDDRLRWGQDAFAAAFDYAMIERDTLRELVYATLASLSRLHSEYVGSSPEILEDDIAPDSLTDLAAAQVRYAALMNLGERLCIARGDYEGQSTYRTDAGRAYRAARAIFSRAGERYLVQFLRSAMTGLHDFSSDWDGESFGQAELPPPDTLAYLQTGARYGFNYLSQRPRDLMRAEALLDGYVWQKWTEYRFRDSVALAESPDLDSLISLLFAGPEPGVLTQMPLRPGPPSLLVMSALLESLAELYLGVQPDMLLRRVMLEPRLPAAWGRTLARVPMGTGYLHLDYDIAHRRAAVSISQIDDSVMVVFGYPLATGGWVRSEFALTTARPLQEIRAEIDSENRVRLSLERR